MPVSPVKCYHDPHHNHPRYHPSCLALFFLRPFIFVYLSNKSCYWISWVEFSVVLHVLKSDYVFWQVHLDKTAEVADHCVVFSLSDDCDPDFRKACKHKHQATCGQCLSLGETLIEIERMAKDCQYPSDDERDEAVYIIQLATLAIQSWKCHILRSWNQDQACFDTMDLIDQKTVLIVNDWAMTFLPQRYRVAV